MLFLDNLEKEEVARIMEENKNIKEAKEARKEGIIDTKEQIVKELINMNLSVQQIAKAVQLSENEVEKILNIK